MAKKCKCQICKTELTIDKAFKIIIKDKNKYYCSENEYNLYQDKINQKNQCLNEITQILNVPLIPPVMIKEINKLNEYYEYIVIEKTFKENEKNIQWFLNNNQDSSEYGKARYIMTIIRNNINKIHKKHIQDLKAMESLFLKSEAQQIDTDIMNINVGQQRNDISDISEFLD